jgi:hypothetical protein
MAMSMNEKLLFLWLLVVVVFGFILHHFLANAIIELGKAIAMNLISLPGLAKFTTGIFGGLFFHCVGQKV